MIDTATGELAPLYGQASVACGNRRETVCPSCSAIYKRDARQLVRAGLAGGKGIPETITGAPVRIRDANRAVVRPGPLPPDARQDRPALPPPPRRQGPPLPARPRHLLPDPARRGRPPARPAHVRRLLRLPRRGAVQRPRGRPVAPVHHLPAPPPGLAGRGHPEDAARPAPHPVRQGRRIPGTRHRPLPRRDPPGRTRRGLPAPARRPTPPTCCATPSAWPPLPPRSSSTTRARPSGSASARRPTPGSSATVTTCPAPARRSTASPSPTTSPSTPPRPWPPPACPPTGYAARPTSTGCAAPPTTGG